MASTYRTARKKLVDALDAYLGYPQHDPHGEPIPNENGKFP